MSNGGGAEKHNQRAPARRPGETEGHTQKNGSARGPGPSGQPLGHAGRVALRQTAGAGGLGAQILSATWAVGGGCPHTPGGSRAGRVRLGLPNSPASGREAEVTTSNHQVRLAALALAQAQACGTETQDRTANCRRGGAGSSSSPAFQLSFNSSRRFSGVGWAGRWAEGPEVGCRNPEGESSLAVVLTFSSCCCFCGRGSLRGRMVCEKCKLRGHISGRRRLGEANWSS